MRQAPISSKRTDILGVIIRLSATKAMVEMSYMEVQLVSRREAAQ
jgi:hypothetical protein